MRFLITARHVLFDKAAADRDYAKFPPSFALQNNVPYDSNKIFEQVFRVPALNDINPNHDVGNLNWLFDYLFSSSNDLAIVCLDDNGF